MPDPHQNSISTDTKITSTTISIVSRSHILTILYWVSPYYFQAFYCHRHQIHAMDMKIIIFSVAILFLSVPTNARVRLRFPNAGQYKEHANFFHKSAIADSASRQSPLEELPPDFICHACLDFSRKVERVLADPGILEKASEVSNEICCSFPSNLQEKCVVMSEAYIQQAILFLKEYLSEEKLCNSTGLCPESSLTISMSSLGNNKPFSAVELVTNKFPNQENSIIHYTSAFLSHKADPIFSPQASDDRSCSTCQEAIKEVLDELKNPVTKIKVIKFLLKACENVENHVKECKKMVFEYGPLIMANVEKYLGSNDVCSMIHACDASGPNHADITEGDALRKEFPNDDQFSSSSKMVSEI